MLDDHDRALLDHAFVDAWLSSRAAPPLSAEEDIPPATDDAEQGRALIRSVWRARTDGPQGNPFAHLLHALGPAGDPERAQRVLTAMRSVLVTTFAYAVPSDEALAAIAALGDIVEVGAGGGYWACCLAERGARVRAFDVKRPGEQNRRGRSLREHHPIQVGGPREALAAAPRADTLLLCWPPGMVNRAEVDAGLGQPRYASMGMEALARFHGSHLVFVGTHSRSFGSPAFYACLERDFTLITRWPLPNLARWRDAAHLYRRRAEGGIPILGAPSRL